jgi:hypothetical protein
LRKQKGGKGKVQTEERKKEKKAESESFDIPLKGRENGDRSQNLDRSD